jgi:uncharacterized membrane protein
LLAEIVAGTVLAAAGFAVGFAFGGTAPVPASSTWTTGAEIVAGFVRSGWGAAAIGVGMVAVEGVIWASVTVEACMTGQAKNNNTNAACRREGAAKA